MLSPTTFQVTRFRTVPLQATRLISVARHRLKTRFCTANHSPNTRFSLVGHHLNIRFYTVDHRLNTSFTTVGLQDTNFIVAGLHDTRSGLTAVLSTDTPFIRTSNIYLYDTRFSTAGNCITRLHSDNIHLKNIKFCFSSHNHRPHQNSFHKVLACWLSHHKVICCRPRRLKASLHWPPRLYALLRRPTRDKITLTSSLSGSLPVSLCLNLCLHN